MVKTIAAFLFSLVATVIVSTVVSAQTYNGTTNTGTSPTSSTTNTSQMMDNNTTVTPTPSGTQQGVGGAGVTMPSGAPNTGLGGLSD